MKGRYGIAAYERSHCLYWIQSAHLFRYDVVGVEVESAISSNVLALSPDKDKYITGLCRSDVSFHFILFVGLPFTAGVNAMLAVSAGSKRNNLFLASDDGSELAWKSTFTTPSPIYSIAWSGSYILAGHWNGVLSLLKPPVEFLADPERPEGKETRLLIKTQYKHQHGQREAKFVAKAGTHVFSSRVHGVEFTPGPYGYPKSPTAPQFYSLCGKGVYLWDVMNSKAAVRVEELGDDLAACGAWSPHHASNPQVMASGDLQGSLRILDFRANKLVVWSAEQKGAIGAVRWSPFVPYWLATAGASGTAFVWDLRHDKAPMVELTGAVGSGLTLDWSNTHADVLLGGSSDHRCYAWSLAQSLAPPPLQFGGQGLIAKDARAFSSPVVRVIASWSRPGRFYAVSDVGELAWLEASDAFNEAVAPHRAAHPMLQECESLVYQRSLGVASTKLMMVMKHNSGDVNQGELDMLCEAAQGYPSDAACRALAEWRLGDDFESSALEPRFAAEVTKFSYGVPFGFSCQRPVCLSDLDAAFAKAASTTFPRRLRALLAAQDVEGLLQLEDSAVEFLRSSYSPMSIDLVTDMARQLLPKHCSAALRMAIRVMEVAMLQSADVTGLAPLVYLILYPTVYDADPYAKQKHNAGYPAVASQVPPARPKRSASRRAKQTSPAQRPTLPRVKSGSPALAQGAIVKLLEAHPQSIVGMIQLEIDIQAIALRCDGDKAGAAIVHTVTQQFGLVGLDDAQAQHFTISSGALKLFLNAMLQLKRYEAFLLHATALDRAFQGGEFSHLLSHLATTVAAPKLKAKLEPLLDPSAEVGSEDFRTVLRFLLQVAVRYNFMVIEIDPQLLKEGLRTLSAVYLRHLKPLAVGSADLPAATEELVTLFELLTLDNHVRTGRALSLPKLSGEESLATLISTFQALLLEILD
ncbi:hypothetical protein L0F63_006124 [Massospora cicadina]|nr:hypothetical protein L0F63_006124 [Massospora cicadina]